MNSSFDVSDLLARPEAEQRSHGYFHTLREILQQPDTWLDTCRRTLARAPDLARLTDGIAWLALTGSGSSLFAGDCVRPALRRQLGITVEAVAAGDLLLHGAGALPAGRPGLLVSMARSGDSPESGAALDLLLAREPHTRHLVITCNDAGRLATAYRGDPRVPVIVLDDRTNDRGLAMTGSLTNMALAARFLGAPLDPETYRPLCEQLSRACAGLLRTAPAALARAATAGFRRAVFLGSGARYGAARESALKLLELTAGRVATLAETYLGLRHGPMSFIDRETLLVCYLSSDPLLRAYETDLIHELGRKQLGSSMLIAGLDIPPDLPRAAGTAIEYAGAGTACEDIPLLDVVVGQLLAFFRSLAEGLSPDTPCESGVIHRVVEPFALHQAGSRPA